MLFLWLRGPVGEIGKQMMRPYIKSNNMGIKRKPMFDQRLQRASRITNICR